MDHEEVQLYRTFRSLPIANLRQGWVGGGKSMWQWACLHMFKSQLSELWRCGPLYVRPDIPTEMMWHDSDSQWNCAAHHFPPVIKLPTSPSSWQTPESVLPVYSSSQEFPQHSRHVSKLLVELLKILHHWTVVTQICNTKQLLLTTTYIDIALFAIKWQTW